MSVLSAVAVFLIVLAAFRYVSLGSICAAVALVPAVFLFEGHKLPVQVVMTAAALLIILRHISNIRRLLRGEESRFRFRQAAHGGCPMAKDDLTGNMATENMVNFLNINKWKTGIDQEAFNTAMSMAADIFTG